LPLALDVQLGGAGSLEGHGLALHLTLGLYFDSAHRISFDTDVTARVDAGVSLGRRKTRGHGQ
jgi:hypothetical protein